MSASLLPGVAPTANNSGKYHCSYNQVHNLCQQAALQIREDKFEPDIILAVSGGGLIPARMLRTHLKVPIRTVSLELYDDRTNQAGDSVKMTQWVEQKEIFNKRVLIVDEVDDSRTTLSYCVSRVREMGPSKIGIFVVHNKQKVKKCNNHWKAVGYQQQEINSDCGQNGDSGSAMSDLTAIDYYRSGEEVPNQWIAYPWDSIDIDSHTKYADTR